MGADGIVRDHHVLDGGRGIDRDPLDLLGELPIGVGDGGAAGEGTRLCRTHRTSGSDACPLRADASAVPVGRCLCRLGQESGDGERHDEHGGGNGFDHVHIRSSLMSE